MISSPILNPSRPELVREADAIFSRYSPYEGEGLQNHCKRIAEFVALLAEREHSSLEHGVVYLLAMLHDLGLVSEQDEGAHYMLRSWSLFERETEALALETSPQTLKECLLLNHKLLPLSDASREAEIFRRAVWIEHSRGVRRYGLPRHVVSDVFARHPRENFDWIMADFFKRTLSCEPTSVVNGIFF